jgi:hypothetical protein
MTNKLSRIRSDKMQAQDGLCHYCRQPMWAGDPAQFRERHGLPRKRARWHECTAEHLHAKRDGGQDTSDNIVAACLFCNGARHHARNPLSPALYAKKVQRRLASGKWHGFIATRRERPARRA